MDIEELLFQQKQQKNRDNKRKGEGAGLVPLTDIKIYQVSFPFNTDYIVAGYMFSAHKPSGDDFLDLTPMNELKERALELKTKGKINSIDELWNAYTECRINPSLIKYIPLSQEESRLLIQNGVEPM